jgi:hypothetical protein
VFISFHHSDGFNHCRSKAFQSRAILRCVSFSRRPALVLVRDIAQIAQALLT